MSYQIWNKLTRPLSSDKYSTADTFSNLDDYLQRALTKPLLLDVLIKADLKIPAFKSTVLGAYDQIKDKLDGGYLKPDHTPLQYSIFGPLGDLMYVIAQIADSNGEANPKLVLYYMKQLKELMPVAVGSSTV